jgi:hypothetical protein
MEAYTRAVELKGGITYGIAGLVPGWTGSPYFVTATLPAQTAIMPENGNISANVVFLNNRELIAGVSLTQGTIYPFKLALFRSTTTTAGTSGAIALL